MELAIIALFAAAISFAFFAFSQRSKLRGLEKSYNEASQENSRLQERCKNLSDENASLKSFEERLETRFKAISLDVLSQNNKSFSDLSAKSVEGLVNPLNDALKGVKKYVEEVEKTRIGAYDALNQRVLDLISAQNSLKDETNHLANALKNPLVRGRWGEIQLKRVAELAGMLEHCDFEEQVSSEQDGEKIRPDMIIHLPGEQPIVVDAKVPLSAYSEAIETDDEEKKKALMEKYANQVRSHASLLSNKKYWSQFEQSPEFVIMFLPGEVFFSAAVKQDPSLLEFAMQKRVIISSPTTLLALLRTAALVWRQQSLTENAEKIIKMGQELYKRLADVSQHVSNLGKSVGSVVSAYNQTIASLETRVFPAARKFNELETGDKNLIELKPVEKPVRELTRNV
ncbi:MAG: DNA recombination protein RmuC [Holosporaceae bacterium]|jgi:DNA recombination protein RmuC|nr:DNA recombination protein RmuC [Holosporaceae bacterium]